MAVRVRKAGMALNSRWNRPRQPKPAFLAVQSGHPHALTDTTPEPVAGGALGQSGQQLAFLIRGDAFENF
jgi:hypothetical protein